MMKGGLMRIDISEADFIRLYQESAKNSYLREVLDKKLNAIIERDLYKTAYKDKQATPEEKEKARRLYLESRGIPFH